MVDCYHMEIMQGNVIGHLEMLLPFIGHIQIASVLDRGAPDHGCVDYRAVLHALKVMEYGRPIGVEYCARRPDAPEFAWLRVLRDISILRWRDNFRHPRCFL